MRYHARALARELATSLGRDTVRGDDPLTGSLVGLHAAVVANLRELHERLKPPAAESPEAEGRGVGAILRSAVRGRLRRRTM